MEAIKFTLKGPQAVIRKPESNSIYFTYNNVHKIMLLGILGAIIGENGYNYSQLKLEFDVEKGKGKKEEQEQEKKLPEFYDSLKDLKIGIVPNAKLGSFVKKMQRFNNSVGYASSEEGNNLIVVEQYLENPNWDIYILDNGSEKYQEVKKYLLNQKCEYIPYIGKNEHFADISDVGVVNDVKKCDRISGNIDSIFIDSKNDKKKDIDETNDINDFFSMGEKKLEFEYREVQPTALSAEIGYTEFKSFKFTNKKMEIKNIDNIYDVDGKIIYFF